MQSKLDRLGIDSKSRTRSIDLEKVLVTCNFPILSHDIKSPYVIKLKRLTSWISIMDMERLNNKPNSFGNVITDRTHKAANWSIDRSPIV